MEDSSFYTATIIIQGITLVVFVGTLIFFGLQWAGARREASLRMRPYLGFDEIAFRDTDRDDVIELDAWVVNYGNIPAANATVFGDFTVNEKEYAPFRCPSKGTVFPCPTSRERWLVGVDDIDKPAILSGKKSLILKLNIKYFSSTGTKYATKTSRNWDSERKSWVNVECELT